MTDKSLDGVKVAILVTDGFEQVELEEPRKALDAAGATTEVISPKDKEVKAWKFKEWGDTVRVNLPLARAQANDFDALLLPGGVINPDALRMDESAVSFVKAFVDAGKPVAAICHGPWTLIEAGAVKGRKMTSWPSLKTDLVNAGAEWVDQEAVVDGNMVTSRNPDDIPAFSRAAIQIFAGSRRQ